jgi:lauroyl/myristoyl acyltransferase
VKRFVVAGLRLLGARSVKAGLLTARALALLTRPLGHGIADGWLAAVFPELDSTTRRAARQRTWENFLQGEAVAAAVAHGRYPGLVPSPRLEALRPPLVLAAFHVGPFQALGAALTELRGELVALDRGQFGAAQRITVLPGGEDEAARARVFNRALATLRSGGFAFMNVDAFHPEQFNVSTIDVPLFDRTLPLARGAFALARLADVPVAPIAARWRGIELEVEIGEPLHPGSGGEQALAQATASWIERYLRARPGEMSVFMLERLRPPVQGR